VARKNARDPVFMGAPLCLEPLSFSFSTPIAIATS
jgi:hypothetical protein